MRPAKRPEVRRSLTIVMLWSVQTHRRKHQVFAGKSACHRRTLCGAAQRPPKAGWGWLQATSASARDDPLHFLSDCCILRLDFSKSRRPVTSRASPTRDSGSRLKPATQSVQQYCAEAGLAATGLKTLRRKITAGGEFSRTTLYISLVF